MNKNTIIDWENFIRGTCMGFALENGVKIGGPGVYVQIDETKAGSRKYNKGRIIDGQWIFGGIEGGLGVREAGEFNSRACFFVCVKNRLRTLYLR